jgi:DNA-binding NtrC family response regulator
MHSLSASEIQRHLQESSRELGEMGRVIGKFPSVAMKLVMRKLADWIAAINLHDEYADRMGDDCDHVPFMWMTGEEGVGKRELVRRIHELVKREYIFELDCESADEHLIRSELFGHTKGVADSPEQPGEGKFGDANVGLLIVYEPQKLPLDCQDRLLKRQKLKPIQPPKGTHRVEDPDPVIIFVARDSPKELMSTGAVLPGLLTEMLPHIHVPPLRERPEDVVLLIEHLLRTKGHEYRGRELSADRDLEEEVLFLLVNFHWPGNIPALREVVMRLIFLVPLSNHEHQITFPMVIESLETYYDRYILDILTPLYRRNRRSQKGRRHKRDEVWRDELRVLRRLMDLGFHLDDLAKPLGISRSVLSKRFKQVDFGSLTQGRPPKTLLLDS